MLLDMGVLAQTDESVLATYCEAYAEVIALTRRIRRTGYTIRAAQGMLASPLVGIREKAYTRLARSEQRLGLSPADRTRVRAAATDDSDEPEEWWAASN